MLFQGTYYLPGLVICLAIYWLILKSNGARLVFLAVASSALLVAVQAPGPERVGVMVTLVGVLVLAVLVYFIGRHLRHRASTPLMFMALAVPLSVLVYFKYLLLWLPAVQLGGVLLPIGVSYYTFKHIHYLIECRRGRFEDATLASYLAYIVFFPMFLAGPIERFTSFLSQSKTIAWSNDAVSPALERILLGVGKKFLLVTLVLEPMLPRNLVMSDGAPTLEPWQIIVACFIKLLVTYFDFSGYTDMVLGTAKLFGFSLMENFDFPLLRDNLADFWRSWHISLSSWARDYVYFPILGQYRTPDLALIATMLTIGVWHGAQPGWALWGLHHGTGLVLYGRYQRWCEKRPFMQRARLTRPWRLASIVAVWWYVSLGYALTFTPATFASSTRLYVKALSLGLF